MFAVVNRCHEFLDAEHKKPNFHPLQYLRKQNFNLHLQMSNPARHAIHGTFMLNTVSIARHAWVDFQAPLVDSTCHADGRRITIVS